MQFTVSHGRLSSALARASNATARRSTSPILEAVLLRATGAGLEVAATDMQVAFSEVVPCEVEGTGAIAIKAGTLTKMVRVLPVGEVKVKALDNSWLQLEAGRSQAKLMGMNAEDFPDLPDPSGVDFAEVEAASVVNLISKTLFSVSTDEARVNLNGALFESDGKTATMVSTDGHRLTKYTAEFPWRKQAGIIVPRRGLEEIRKLLSQVDDDCSIGLGDGHLFVRANGVTLSVKLNNVTFPPWQQVVPKDHKTSATVKRSSLLDALRQATVIAPHKTQTVAITLTPEKMVLVASNEALGEVKLEVPATWTGSGEFRTGMNGEYMIEALTAIESDEAELRFQSELDPVVFAPVDDPQDLIAVVMPMRI